MVKLISPFSKRKLRVCHFTTVHPRNDVRVFERLAHTVSARYPGCFQLLVADGIGDDFSGLVPVCDLGKMPHARLLRILKGWWLGTLLAVRVRPDIIHFHDPELLPLAPVWKLMGIKVIYDVHEELRKQLLGKKWIPSWARKPMARFSGFVEDFLAGFADAISAATPVIAENFPVRKTWVIQNFPSTREGFHEVRGTKSGNVFFYVGGINRKRGMLEVLDALELVSEKVAVRLTLAGQFSSKEIENKMRSHQAWRLIDYVGWAGRKDVAQYMSESICGIVLCHPESNFMEAQPTKLFEYMWGGLSVIASDFPYWRKSVSEAEGIHFVSPVSVADIEKAMLSIIANREKAISDGDKLKRFAMDNFSWENQEENIFAMYEHVLKDIGR